jgi:menaquinone-9 beta-reductase
MTANQTGPFLAPPDLFIIGAGPSGLACAIAAARRGLRVEIADARKPPIDKACGEGLLPDALDALEELGLPPQRLKSDGAKFSGIRFVQDNPGHHRPVEALFPHACGIGIRRTVLHRLLVDHALALGVRLRWDTVVTGLTGHRVQTNRGALRSRWIVGADGHQSRVRAFAGLERFASSRLRCAFRQHFTGPLWTNMIEVYWADHAQAYVTPVSPDEICIAFVGSRKLSTIENTLQLFPSLSLRLGAFTASGLPRGAVTSTRHLRRVTSRNIALIGDASGSVDAITGQGLALGFRQALALGEALEQNNLNLYETAHTRLSKLPTLMANTLLLMDRYPFAARQAFRAFERIPSLFPTLLDLHVGYQPSYALSTLSLLVSTLGFLSS